MQLQRIILTLLSGSLQAIHRGESIGVAMISSWDELLWIGGVKATAEQKRKDIPNRRVQPISRSAAIGYWVFKGMAPSYDSFIALVDGAPVDWHQSRFSGSVPDVNQLLAAGRRLAGRPVNSLPVDIDRGGLANTIR